MPPKARFCLCCAGADDQSHRGNTFDCRNGGTDLFPAGTCYTSEYSREGTETKIVQFDLMQGELPTYLSAPRKIALPDAGEWMDRFFIPVQAHPFYYLSEIYAFLQRIEEQETRLPAKFRRLQPAMAELEAHLTGNDRVGHYAALCGMSEAGFRRLFREYIGCSPVEYRNALRLERARTLLQSGEYNVSEAAERSGFRYPLQNAWKNMKVKRKDCRFRAWLAVAVSEALK